MTIFQLSQSSWTQIETVKCWHPFPSFLAYKLPTEKLVDLLLVKEFQLIENSYSQILQKFSTSDCESKYEACWSDNLSVIAVSVIVKLWYFSSQNREQKLIIFRSWLEGEKKYSQNII